MSEVRKCTNCSRPADFLSAHCIQCAENSRKSTRKFNAKQRNEKLKDPGYVKRRRNWFQRSKMIGKLQGKGTV